MAEHDSGQERSEQPTEKRLRESREKGQIPRSRELNTMAVMVLGTAWLWLGGGAIGADMAELMRSGLQFERADLLGEHVLSAQLSSTVLAALGALAPMLALLLIVALCAPIVLGGWAFSLDQVVPKWQRVSPLAGIKRLFSLRSLMELLKGVLKVLFVGAVGYALVAIFQEPMLLLSGADTAAAIQRAGEILALCFVLLSASLVLIAAIDAPFQLWQFKEQQKMTQQEVRDESKETNGKPEVKQRLRQLQQQYARARMLDRVAQADVVIVNPEHFAVALQYRSERMAAPQLVAKGTEAFALQIRALARRHRVPVVRIPALARAIFYTTRVEAEIPGQLYLAVAQVLAFVQQLREARRRGAAPPPPPRPQLPPELLARYEGERR